MSETRALPGYAIRYDGQVLPRPVGGHPALDFCNTRADWGTELADNPRAEWLRGYDQLAAFVGLAGLADRRTVRAIRRLAAEHPTRAARRLERARLFRAALYRTLLGPPDPAARELVATACERANSLVTLTIPARRPASWELPPADLDTPSHAIALAAAELLCGPDRAHVRACPGDECGWLFLDPRGRRRWCSMTTCGNRAKVRDHAARAAGRSRPPNR